MLFVLGVRSNLLKAVYLMREGERLLWDGIKYSSFGNDNLKQLVEEGRRTEVSEKE